jgi:uncharacterized protein (DUF111 family)
MRGDVSELLYLEPVRGITEIALVQALTSAGIASLADAAQRAVYCAPLPLGGVSEFSASLVAGLGLRPGMGFYDESGLLALRQLRPNFAAPPLFRALSRGEGSHGGSLVRALCGELLQESAEEERESLVVLEANVDDLSPQLVEVFLQRAFSAGALDAWSQPLAMKKGRPALLLGALCRPEARAALEEVFFLETSTLGVRSSRVERRALAREFVSVETRFGSVSIKLGRLRGDIVNAQPEFDDLRARAEAAGVPVKRVQAEALAVFWRGVQSER